MVKVIVQMYPVLPASSEEERINLRPIGRNSELYQKTLRGWCDIIEEADRIGIWGATAIEHHFHSEGYEMSPNPGVINAFWGAKTSNINIGQLGYVMSAANPIRVAEETAILDHLMEGRTFVGFSRGFQSRWTDLLGQHLGTKATRSDDSSDDELNREIFEERVEMLLKCWTEESVRLEGNHYQAPYPIETGIENYPAWKIARDAGVIGEVDENGTVQRVCVVPKPYQNPRPPVFVGVNKSPEGIRFCAKNDLIPTYFMTTEGMTEFVDLYVEEAAKYGRHLVRGQKQNMVRWPHITKTPQDYDRKLLEYDLDIYKNLYGPFFPFWPQGRKSDSEHIQDIKNSGFFIGGTVEESIQKWRATYEQVPAEYITLIFHWAQQPKEDLLEEIELFMTKVLPELEVPDYATAAE